MVKLNIPIDTRTNKHAPEELSSEEVERRLAEAAERVRERLRYGNAFLPPQDPKPQQH